ncbi:unnamed protein product [Spirodela intermedia]|uniref:Uncharacterized protein n=1 Tax=Spirodela intermedia TaxID=51605 RepID=A0A7I8IUV0_SPIIN|nr:unnamed protein product [Spirodela intermedia]CAA6661794.1 unnamed protein product [Spirodela intermedia]
MATTKLGLLRNSLKSIILSSGGSRGLPSRSLSTTVASGDQDASFSDSFVNPPPGMVFGRLTNIGRNTLKTDIIHYFEGCDLSAEDIKVEYNKLFNPTGMLVQFPSRSSFDTALRLIMRKGRLYNLTKIDRGLWDLQTSYSGKTVLLKAQRNAIQEDVERIFRGCNYDGSSTEIFLRPGPVEPVKLALVRFPTREEAMTAVRLRNRSFCLNTPW